MKMNKILIPIGISIILLGIIIFQWQRNKLLSAQLQNYEIQILNLKEQSKQQADRFETARKEAEASSSQIEDKSKDILNSNVSSDCNLAIQWGIEKAKGI